jgi:hypothetical protein
MSTFRFFVNESNSFFAFDHEKTNYSFFFTFTKLKYETLLYPFFFRAQSSLNKTQRFVSRSNQNIHYDLMSLRSKSCMRSDIKYAKKHV